MKYLFVSCFIFLGICSCESGKFRVLQLEYRNLGCANDYVTRVYLNDSIFLEYSGNEISSIEEPSTIDTFKVVNSNWYEKKCGYFRLYFSIDSFLNNDTIYGWDNRCKPFFKFIPQDEKTVNGKRLFRYKVEEQHYNYFAPIVWFDPEFGIVKIESPSSKCKESNVIIISDKLLNRKALTKSEFKGR